MSLFNEDIQRESILSSFLDKAYKDLGFVCRRVNDLGQQHQGIDISMLKSGSDFKIDEKAQVHYLNQSLPTFALELAFKRDGSYKSGWLFNTRKSTEYYHFVFNIQTKNGAYDLKNENDILSCDIVSVNRLKLIIELGDRGLTKKICDSYCERLINSTQKKITFSLDSSFNFQISRHLEEEPINLVVRREFLESIGEKYVISE